MYDRSKLKVYLDQKSTENDHDIDKVKPKEMEDKSNVDKYIRSYVD